MTLVTFSSAVLLVPILGTPLGLSFGGSVSRSVVLFWKRLPSSGLLGLLISVDFVLALISDGFVGNRGGLWGVTSKLLVTSKTVIVMHYNDQCVKIIL